MSDRACTWIVSTNCSVNCLPGYRIPASAAVDTTQLHPVPAAMDDDDVSSPFAAAAGPTAAPQSNLTPTYTSGSVSDADAAAIAAEAADDLAALPDASARAASATAAAAAALRAKAAPSSASGADTLTQRTTSGRRKPRKMIPLKRVRVICRPLLVHATSLVRTCTPATPRCCDCDGTFCKAVVHAAACEAQCDLGAEALSPTHSCNQLSLCCCCCCNYRCCC